MAPPSRVLGATCGPLDHFRTRRRATRKILVSRKRRLSNRSSSSLVLLSGLLNCIRWIALDVSLVQVQATESAASVFDGTELLRNAVSQRQNQRPTGERLKESQRPHVGRNPGEESESTPATPILAELRTTTGRSELADTQQSLEMDARCPVASNDVCARAGGAPSFMQMPSKPLEYPNPKGGRVLSFEPKTTSDGFGIYNVDFKPGKFMCSKCDVATCPTCNVVCDLSSCSNIHFYETECWCRRKSDVKLKSPLWRLRSDTDGQFVLSGSVHKVFCNEQCGGGVCDMDGLLSSLVVVWLRSTGRNAERRHLARHLRRRVYDVFSAEVTGARVRGSCK
ncbi:unnamed protein product [Amoebophrya sp. A25]|nr:unnamed protein product [Amoebophrya sp. A25]|eukprot:GSA25T00004261001.1